MAIKPPHMRRMMYHLQHANQHTAHLDPIRSFHRSTTIFTLVIPQEEKNFSSLKRSIKRMPNIHGP
ncbi:hypothetical protein OCU04_009301 [Sclerotinia nivalis]|uniref:Uncharacterized protein n=1 Tax=Sclerotinia nivalis TaxID=352851 RepID=A0A9X0DFD2_9HELO|nr:hypothetical protein OCU04_009301 [Sclerotinia nivalis]